MRFLKDHEKGSVIQPVDLTHSAKHSEPGRHRVVGERKHAHANRIRVRRFPTGERHGRPVGRQVLTDTSVLPLLKSRDRGVTLAMLYHLAKLYSMAMIDEPIRR